jgi:signal transduction histidine kinase
LSTSAATRRNRTSALLSRFRRWLGGAPARQEVLWPLLDLLPVPVALWGAGFARLNAAMASRLDLERSDAPARGWDWQRHVDARDWPAWAAAVELAKASGSEQWLQVRVVPPMGDETLAHIAPLPAATADFGGHAFAVVLLEGADAAARQATLRLRRLLDMADEEKWRFGQAVHDELGQRLSGMAYFAKALERRLQEQQRPEAEDAAWLNRLANESMAAARGLAHGLVPVGSDDPQALMTALGGLCATTGKAFGVTITLQGDADFRAGGVAQANHLYHAIQELLSNGIRHGAARRAEVRLVAHASGRRVRVFNDGAPLPTRQTQPRRGMGLDGVRARVAHLGGRFTLADAQGGGVVATIELGLPGAEGDRVSP